MTSTKHEKGDGPFADNLERNPGIGQSKGAFATGENPAIAAGENSVEGDIDNDTTMTDGVPQRERGRTNK